MERIGYQLGLKGTTFIRIFPHRKQIFIVAPRDYKTSTLKELINKHRKRIKRILKIPYYCDIPIRIYKMKFSSKRIINPLNTELFVRVYKNHWINIPMHTDSDVKRRFSGMDAIKFIESQDMRMILKELEKAHKRKRHTNIPPTLNQVGGVRFNDKKTLSSTLVVPGLYYLRKNKDKMIGYADENIDVHTIRTFLSLVENIPHAFIHKNTSINKIESPLYYISMFQVHPEAFLKYHQKNDTLDEVMIKLEEFTLGKF